MTQQITGGTLGGTLQFRSQMLEPARNALGQIAVVLTSAVNAQNQAGLDQSGNPGQAVFSVGARAGAAQQRQCRYGAITASVSNANAVTTDNYILKYDGANWSLSNASTGASVALSGAGTVASPFTADGLSLVVGAGAQAGDSYRIEPDPRRRVRHAAAADRPEPTGRRRAAADVGQQQQYRQRQHRPGVGAQQRHLGARQLHPEFHQRHHLPGDQ